MPKLIRELLKSGVVVVGDGGYLIELERRGHVDSGSGREKLARNEGIGYAGGCCGCNAAYIHALARGVETAAHG